MRCVVKPFPTALTDAELDDLHGLSAKAVLLNRRIAKFQAIK
jgi:hypothetical protein